MRGKITLGIAALAASVVVPAAASTAATNTATPNSVSGAAVAAGTVTDPSGAAMPGAAVDLYAWPSDAVLAAMKPGQAVPRTLLTTATTNSAGQYALRVPVAKLEAAAVDSGYANLEIDSPVGGFWFFPYQTGSLPAKPPAAVAPRLSPKIKCGKDPNGNPYGFIGWFLVHQKSPANAVVGQGYIIPAKKTRGDWVNFQYTQTSSHSQASSLGVGISGYGLSAGYSTGGSKTSTVVRGEGYPNSDKNAWFRTEFNTAQYRGYCYETKADLKVPHAKQHGACPKKWLPPGYANVPTNYRYVRKCYWQVMSTGWFGGSTTAHPSKAPPTPARYCAYHQPGAHFNYDYGSAVDWSSGFTVGAAIGIKGVNLKADFGTTAHTGYDANALMYFQFRRGGYLCGTNASEASAAILVQRSNKR